MTPDTRATCLRVLGQAHDALIEDLYRQRTTRYAKWGGAFAPNPERVRMARELRALRRALRELEPGRWPAWYADVDEAARVYHREGR